METGYFPWCVSVDILQRPLWPKLLSTDDRASLVLHVTDEVRRKRFWWDAAELFVVRAQRPQFLQFVRVSGVRQHEVKHRGSCGTKAAPSEHGRSRACHSEHKLKPLQTEVDALPVVTVSPLQPNVSLLVLPQKLELQIESGKCRVFNRMELRPGESPESSFGLGPVGIKKKKQLWHSQNSDFISHNSKFINCNSYFFFFLQFRVLEIWTLFLAISSLYIAFLTLFLTIPSLSRNLEFIYHKFQVDYLQFWLYFLELWDQNPNLLRLIP